MNGCDFNLFAHFAPEHFKHLPLKGHRSVNPRFRDFVFTHAYPNSKRGIIKSKKLRDYTCKIELFTDVFQNYITIWVVINTMHVKPLNTALNLTSFIHFFIFIRILEE